MKFEVGKEYRTRRGQKATIVYINYAFMDYPIYAEIKNHEGLEDYTQTGRHISPQTDSELDLIAPWVDLSSSRKLYAHRHIETGEIGFWDSDADDGEGEFHRAPEYDITYPEDNNGNS